MRAFVLRLARLLVAVEQRVRALEIGETVMASEFDQLSADVTSLTTAESDAEARVAAEVSSLQAEIDALKAGNPDIAAQLSGIEAVTARLAALAVPATPPPVPAPAPTPEPTPAPPLAPETPA